MATMAIGTAMGWLAAGVFGFGLAACSRSPSEVSAAATENTSAQVPAAVATGPSTAPPSAGSSAPSSGSGSGDRIRVQIVDAPPEGDAAGAVREALTRASAAKRTLVVYVGATWCEPCQRFHHAAERGELDAELPSITLLDFDLDRDRDRLVAAGYSSKYIPLFALPGPDGRASGKQIEGGIKGEGAVGFIVPRLKEMLAE